jgi:DNA invertase Pin-like site-specific DNA recombinase
MARVAIYYRVSTVDQSVDGQISELREYAERRGFEISGEFVDHCSGAARQRPELDRMMGDVRQCKADVVLVWAFDRFARSTSHLVSTLEELQSLGVDFISYKQQIDTSTAAGKLTFTVLAAIAEFEREMIRERVKTGMANAKRVGTKSGNPIGRPRITASKQSRIRAMRNDGVSYTSISKQLGLAKSVVFRYAKCG